jgi:DNA-binding LacI/PurR family transcriptional regulator
MRALLARPDRPEALITASDSIAVVLVNAAHTLGLAVGRDILVTGFDGSALGGIVEPALTTVRIPVERIAAELVERLIGVLDGRAPDRGLIVPTTLALGGTA